jgi:hypothetical protein
MYTSELMQKVQFINGTFTPTEAREVILKVIDDQINYHKLQHLSSWIKDDSVSPELLENKIAELERRKRELTGLIREARAEGAKLTINGGFNISMVK